MRFAADGPDVPDDLLLARDQGRVVFFCGAGVSRARAGLPDFYGLARAVTSSLGVSEESTAHKLLSAAQEIEKQTGIPGVVSADRVFGQLEGDFLTRDVEAAVAAALNPPSPCDLSAHQLLLDLATTPEGLVQLVTTNFDRLFDACGRNLPTWKPPRLPNPAHPTDMNGIVYLHGRAAADYSGAEEEGFILSSSSFGRAYLSDGWATQFFKDVIRTYVVVFVGYAADDPPVQYLLEALSKAAGKIENTYAFQAGEAAEAATLWRRKGVRAIPYDPQDSHDALWQSLSAWADRARDVDAWNRNVLAKARSGPQALAAHERGQVAHMISTYEGAKRFAEAPDPPPAEWLCVFDRLRRYEKPGYIGRFRERGPYVDPFDAYGLDADETPKKIGPEDRGEKRDTPARAWDGLTVNQRDRASLRDTHLASFRGSFSELETPLVPRLGRMGQWLSRVAHQPAALWWALRQGFLNREIQRSIRWQSHQDTTGWNAEIREAWWHLFEAWDDRDTDDSHEWYELEALIRSTGWEVATVRRYGNVRRPRLEVRANIWGGPMPPQQILKASDLLSRLVHYPQHHGDIHVPDEWLAATVAVTRRNLETALDSENELGGYGLVTNVPIIADPSRDPNDRRVQQTQSLSGLVAEYVSLLTRLSEFDNPSARRELGAWPRGDETIFAKLRIWAAGQVSLSSPTSAEETFTELSPRPFWDPNHQRDFLIALLARWTSLSDTGRSKIESMLLRGPESWAGEDPCEFEERNAGSILNRIQWLSAQGVVFGFDLPATIEVLRRKVPRWGPSFGEHAADSMEGRSGWVHTRTDHAGLVTEPLGSLLIRAERESGRTSGFLVENDPYAGLAAERPARAIAALTLGCRLISRRSKSGSMRFVSRRGNCRLACRSGWRWHGSV